MMGWDGGELAAGQGSLGLNAENIRMESECLEMVPVLPLEN